MGARGCSRVGRKGRFQGHFLGNSDRGSVISNTPSMRSGCTATIVHTLFIVARENNNNMQCIWIHQATIYVGTRIIGVGGRARI